MPWLPSAFVHPERVELPTGEHLRPIREADVELDHPAVMGSRDRLWSLYGDAWGWPPATMTVEQDRADLARHEEEIAAHLSFNYALFDVGETRLLGCIYIDPDGGDPNGEGDQEGAGDHGAGALVSWWLVDEMVGSELERVLDHFVPDWLDSAWPFREVRYGAE